jgi:hypothetical protein
VAALLALLVGAYRAVPQQPSQQNRPAPSQPAAAPQSSPAPPLQNPPPAQTSKQGIAFWDLPESRMQAMLKDSPYREEDRYARLRGYFGAFGCSGDRLSEMTFDPGRHHKVLVCTLPGAVDRKILVTAWYPHADVLNGASDGWPDAVVLPMLYHALQAQPRQFTFVFAALSGQHALLNLLSQYRAAERSLPVVLVSVDVLGLGPPQFTVVPSDAVPAPVRPNADLVRTEAWRVAYLMHIDPRKTSVPSAYASTPMLSIPAFTPEGAKGIPGIIVYSSPIVQPGVSAAMTFSDFRLDHDFLGFYLCDLDRKLDGSL